MAARITEKLNVNYLELLAGRMCLTKAQIGRKAGLTPPAVKNAFSGKPVLQSTTCKLASLFGELPQNLIRI